MSILQRSLIVLAAALGAAGVAAAAGASHAGGALLEPLSLIALTHAPALLALALYGPARRRHLVPATALALGATLFCADLGIRHAIGTSLFPLAAPLGGLALIAGWLLVAVSALLKRAP